MRGQGQRNLSVVGFLKPPCPNPAPVSPQKEPILNRIPGIRFPLNAKPFCNILSLVRGRALQTPNRNRENRTRTPHRNHLRSEEMAERQREARRHLRMSSSQEAARREAAREKLRATTPTEGYPLTPQGLRKRG